MLNIQVDESQNRLSVSPFIKVDMSDETDIVEGSDAVKELEGKLPQHQAQ